MVRWDKEAQEKKGNKFIRDSGDFAVRDGFKWQSGLPTPAPVPIVSTQSVFNVLPLGTPRFYQSPQS